MIIIREMLLKLKLLLCVLATAYAERQTSQPLDSRNTGRPTLSEPFGTNSEHEVYRVEAGYDYVKGDVWPKPQQESRTNDYYTLDPRNFDIKSTGQQSDVIIAAMARYKALTFPDSKIKPDKTMKQMLNLEVKVELPYKPMDLMMDESYTLVVGAPTSSLVANTCWGALRGLETFSQVVHQNKTGFYHVQQNKVVDFPRFHHRGYLIDTARRFVLKKYIYQFIDALAYSKFNILHWHIVDDDSFPYVSKRFPQMAKQGARNFDKHIYTRADILDIIDYGRLHGVRILPEFDTPGHVGSWGSIPNFLTPCYSGGKPNGKFGPVNPTIESNYEFLKEFFAEVAGLFTDSYLHLGGDEVPFGCWASNPDILDWMSKHGMGKNFSLLEQYYEQRLLDIVGNLGKNYVIWQEVVDNQVKVKDDTVVNVWRGHGDEWKAEVAKVTKLGYRTILSSPWYLNYISYGQDWTPYFKQDPQDFPGTKEQKDSVIGGTACMWGEWVDAVNLISRSWGRGMAVAGRLWSSEDTKDVGDAWRRMWEHRCRYLRRGLNADSVTQSQWCRHEWGDQMTS